MTTIVVVRRQKVNTIVYMKIRSSKDSDEFHQVSRMRRWTRRLEDVGARYFAYSRLVGKPDWKRSLGSLRRGSEVGIGMELELFVGACIGTSWLRIWFIC